MAEHPAEQTDEHPIAEERARRRFDPAGPVAGGFFLALTGFFLAEGLTVERLLNPVLVVPLVLIGLGLVGAVRVATRGRRRDRAEI